MTRTAPHPLRGHLPAAARPEHPPYPYPERTNEDAGTSGAGVVWVRSMATRRTTGWPPARVALRPRSPPLQPKQTATGSEALLHSQEMPGLRRGWTGQASTSPPDQLCPAQNDSNLFR
jgi:hypothetical protein